MSSNIIGLIPARSGSKGVADKNLSALRGRSLICHAAEYVKEAEWIGATYISTDSNKYSEHAKSYGIGSLGLRDESLAGDSVKSVDVLLDFVSKYESEYGGAPDWICLLQPTSPIRPHFSRGEIVSLVAGDDDAFIAVSKVVEPHPYKLKKVGADGCIEAFIPGGSSETPRQELPAAYSLTGALYLVRVSTLLKERTLLPKRSRPLFQSTFCNIDTQEDLEFAEWIMRKRA